MKNKSVIVINDRHYDARTGKPLHGQEPKPSAPKTAHHAHTGHRSASYRPTSHIKPHKAESAHTLMRKGVKKPDPSAKRRIKVQGSLGPGNGREQSRIISHREPESYARHARNHAVKVTHSHLISHFSPELFSVDNHTSLAVYGSGAVNRSAAHHAVKRVRANKLTTDELLDYAVQHAATPRHHTVKRRKMIRHRPHAKHHA